MTFLPVIPERFYQGYSGRLNGVYIPDVSEPLTENSDTILVTFHHHHSHILKNCQPCFGPFFYGKLPWYNTAMSIEKTQIVNALQHTLTEKKEILFAYIFGSFVDRETYRDIDVALYLKDPQGIDTLWFELALEEELERRLHFPFDVRVINNAPLGFVYHVLAKKILVLDRDTDCRAKFESLVLREYFDFRHLLQEYLREVKNAPV